jgi:pantoate--beta-alanine ligase
MRIVRAIPELRRELGESRLHSRTVGLVPTMGALHLGHLSLITRARAECDVVVVSLFVNPTQFNDPADLAAYPRDERRDATLAEEAGADLMFAPRQSDLYPAGFATEVSVPGLGDVLEGAHRGPGHFIGVATVVVKLLNIVAPDTAYFGQKDAQQTLVIRRMVRDLNMAVRIATCPTVRASDGLALSSRNARLSPAGRERATALYRSLLAAEEAVRAGERDPDVVIEIARHELVASGVEPEYFALVEPDSFALVGELEGDALAVVAASIDDTRLIDNHLIHVPAAPGGGEANTHAAPCGSEANTHATPRGGEANTHATPRGSEANTHAAPRGSEANTDPAAALATPAA